MDDIVRTCANKHLKNSKNLQFVEDSVIQHTYGFEYQRHFRNMLIQVLGIINVEKLENNLDGTKFHPMESTLGTLKTYRDNEAHTHLKGATKRLDAPSVTRNHFQKVYDGLKDIEHRIRSMRF